jgi:predicted nuclease of predicted toxin-antitoxin system
MKFLVDENLSKSDKFLKDHPEFVNVKHLMKPVVADDEIIEKALVHDFMIVTKDIKLALNFLIRGVRVWYYDAEKNTEYKLVAKHPKMTS